MAKARPLRNAARKPEAKTAKSTIARGAADRITAPAAAPKTVRTATTAAKPVKAPAPAPERQAAPPPPPAVPPPLPAPIASFTF